MSVTTRPRVIVRRDALGIAYDAWVEARAMAEGESDRITSSFNAKEQRSAEEAKNNRPELVAYNLWVEETRETS